MRTPEQWAAANRRYGGRSIEPCPCCDDGFKRPKWRRCTSCDRAYSLAKYKPIRRASARVHSAIEAGRLARPTEHTCVDCGKPATEYDHRDYSKPLEVDPVCHPCNKRRGPGLHGYSEVPKQLRIEALTGLRAEDAAVAEYPELAAAVRGSRALRSERAA